MVASLKDICIAIEGELQKKNIAWRYTSSRDVKNLLLEDGKGTIISIRYSKAEHHNYIHIIEMPTAGMELNVYDYFLNDISEIPDILGIYID